MVSKAFKECLIDIYRGEQVGEAIFEASLLKADDDEQRYVLGSMLQLETEGKAKIRPVLMKFGLSVAEQAEARTEGASAAAGLLDMSWSEQFDAMAKGIEAVYLPKYERLATLVTEDEDAEAYELATFMGQHERAVMTAAENIASGQPNPMAPVVDLLHFPLSMPVTR